MLERSNCGAGVAPGGGMEVDMGMQLEVLMGAMKSMRVCARDEFRANPPSFYSSCIRDFVNQVNFVLRSSGTRCSGSPHNVEL